MPSYDRYRTERQFGLLVGGLFAALGVWWIWRGKFPTVAAVLTVLGGTLFVLGTTLPRLLVRPYRGWMTLAEGLSWVMTRVVLGIVFFLIVTPIGLVKRMNGWDPLRRRGGPSASYWHPYTERHRDPKHFEKMY